jgi:hypothetical protein
MCMSTGLPFGTKYTASNGLIDGRPLLLINFLFFSDPRNSTVSMETLFK